MDGRKRWGRSLRRRPAHGERGAVAVEAALITPVLFMVLIGIIEMSLLMRDVVAMTSAARAGSRVAAVSAAAGPGGCAGGAGAPTCAPGNSPMLAQAAADAVQRSSSTMPKSSISSLYVYKANTQGYPLPEGNTSLTCAQSCVRFVWVPSINRFRYAEGTWNSASINACVNESDSVGVALSATHTWMSGLFGDGWNMQERSVVRFEPLPNDSCKPGTPAAHS